MGIKSIIGATCACLAVVSFNANAALVERLGGLAYYDDVADLTWLADANAAGTSMNWATANQWAADLVVAGNDNWRLASALNSDNTGPCDTTNCTDSEMGNLFYNVLGGTAGTSIVTAHNSNYDLFSNVQSAFYWSATEYAPNTGAAWNFNMANGDQSVKFKTNISDAWAVQSGDVSAVPVPAAVWLFASGLFGLASLARHKKA